jgi:cytosine/adenosine deaminase-related metal-dependent hydrolase
MRDVLSTEHAHVTARSNAGTYGEGCHLNALGQNQLVIREARCTLGPQETTQVSVGITGDRITRILSSSAGLSGTKSDCEYIDLGGYLLLPGFVNAHDHLEFALFPRLGNPPYRNYIEWGDDIHSRFSDIIAKHRAVPKEIRLWWGGIRNLLCGVTTVSHHNPFWPELERVDFPIRVVRDYGWGHSLALGGDLSRARVATPAGRPFIVHACEGVDELAREELSGIDCLGVLDDSTVLVHGLAIDDGGVALMRDRRASLIVCPSSNKFLFERLPNLCVLGKVEKIALGSDSPLTAEGDLLDEIRFAMRFCGISASTAYQMVVTAPAAILRLGNAEGSIRESGLADLVAVRDTGQHFADRLKALSMSDIELVMIGGRVQLAAEAILERLPFTAKHGLEPLSIDGSIRWLRAPVKALLQKTEEVLGSGEVRLGCRKLLIPDCVGTEHVN